MDTFEKAREFIYRNARPLDLARWQYHFENGSKEAVLNALSYYQNEDGGFGYAIEPDLWNEKSSPISTSNATTILRELKFYDFTNNIVKDVLYFLENTSFQHNCGWNLKIPSNNDYPHSPWWTYTKESEIGFHGKSEFNPTAAIISYTIKAADKSSKLYEKSLSIAREAAIKVLQTDTLEMHEAGGLAQMFSNFPLGDVTKDSKFLLNKLKIIVKKGIEKNTSKWNQYVAKPSNYFNSKDSIFYTDNKEISEYECDFIMETQLDDGSWDISWGWNDYPEQWAVAKNWWKSNGILTNMLFLKGMEKL